LGGEGGGFIATAGGGTDWPADGFETVGAFGNVVAGLACSGGNAVTLVGPTSLGDGVEFALVDVGCATTLADGEGTAALADGGGAGGPADGEGADALADCNVAGALADGEGFALAEGVVPFSADGGVLPACVGVALDGVGAALGDVGGAGAAATDESVVTADGATGASLGEGGVAAAGGTSVTCARDSAASLKLIGGGG
jgi:hypothetical protein